MLPTRWPLRCAIIICSPSGRRWQDEGERDVGDTARAGCWPSVRSTRVMKRSDDAEFVERLLEENDSFRKLLEERRSESDQGQVRALQDIRPHPPCSGH